LYGGAAIYANTADSKQDQPLRPGDYIRSLVVLSQNSLVAGPVVRDIDSDYYGKAEFYTLRTGESGAEVRIHASRLAIFVGKSIPVDPAAASLATAGWGDSALQSTLDAVTSIDSTMANIA